MSFHRESKLASPSTVRHIITVQFYFEAKTEILNIQGVVVPAHLSLIDDEQWRWVEAVGRLPLQHRLQAAKLIQDWFKEVLPQTRSVVHVLVEGLAEAFDRQAAAVVLVPAEVVTGVQLVHLKRQVHNRDEHLNIPSLVKCISLCHTLDYAEHAVRFSK